MSIRKRSYEKTFTNFLTLLIGLFTNLHDGVGQAASSWCPFKPPLEDARVLRILKCFLTNPIQLGGYWLLANHNENQQKRAIIDENVRESSRILELNQLSG